MLGLLIRGKPLLEELLVSKRKQALIHNHTSPNPSPLDVKTGPLVSSDPHFALPFTFLQVSGSLKACMSEQRVTMQKIKQLCLPILQNQHHPASLTPQLHSGLGEGGDRV